VNLPGVNEAERLETILARFDAAQASIRTLEADFDERKELALFKEPVVSAGRFYYASPHQAKWEHLQPEPKVFLITDSAVVQYFPDEKLLERKELSAANANRLFKFFGMGQSSKDLEKMYEISLGNGPSADMPETYELLLKPRRKMVEKRVARVHLWVGDRDFLPRGLKVDEADGDFTLWRFSNVHINTELPAGVFELNVPDDVEVRRKISLFSSSEDSAP
jgi:outer membrane lipoprotein-sorting protein